MEFDKKLINKVNNLPSTPGIYKYKDSLGKIIYVGKAKNLKNRVKSYFHLTFEKGTKTARLVENIADVEYVEVLSEMEAFILEAALIKKYRPRYNIALKDDKSYLYIVIRDKKLPKVLAARENDLEKGDITFGPYPEGRLVRKVLRSIRKAIPYRDCSKTKFNKYHKLNQPCLYGQIGLCPAPCTDRVSSTEYKKEISKLKKLLSGKTTQLLKDLNLGMKKASKNKDYEKAAKLRDQINNLEYVRQHFSSASKYIQNPYLVDDLVLKAQKDLVEALPILNELPERIECYDISTISGKDAVGSMVVATNGRIDKSQYRRFKIRKKDTPDDFAMMKEVLQRRLSRELENSEKTKWGLPKLLVVDGGKGQLSIALEVIQKLNIQLPLIGLAKKRETIIYFMDGKFVELNLPKDNLGLQLIQRLRDESHRFAQDYHHRLRLRSLKS